MMSDAAGNRKPAMRIESMEEDERRYLELRAESELFCAQAAKHPRAVKAHYSLAELYLDRLYPNEAKAIRHTSF